MENERNKEEKLSKFIVDWENGTQVALCTAVHVSP